MSIASRNRFRVAGFTLVELMVAAAISAIVLSGVAVILAGTYKNQQMQKGLYEIQEHGRLAIEIISRDVRSAGFMGCNTSGNFTNHLDVPTGVPPGAVSGTPPTRYLIRPLKGFEHSVTDATMRKWYPPDPGDPTVPSEANDKDSDAFILTFAVASGLELEGIDATMKEITLVDSSSLERGDFLYLANCQGSDLFQISNKGSGNKKLKHKSSVPGITPGNSTDTLRNMYAVRDATDPDNPIPGDDAYGFVFVHYHIMDDPNNNNVPTLFRSIPAPFRADPAFNTNEDIALIPWVENMQVLYGLIASEPDEEIRYEYLPAHDVLDWDEVQTMRIALLVGSGEETGRLEENRGDDEYPIAVLDYEFPDDNKRVRRQVFSTTVNLRNGFL